MKIGNIQFNRLMMNGKLKEREDYLKSLQNLTVQEKTIFDVTMNPA